VLVSLAVSGDVAVIRVVGRLDDAALQPCRAAMDESAGQGMAVVLEVSEVTASAASVALLGAMRRYAAARQVHFRLAGVRADLNAHLAADGVQDLYGLPGIIRRARGG
jgi:anti-anti-sigma regulatory factor